MKIKVGETELDFLCDWSVGIGGSLWTNGHLLVDHLQRRASYYAPLCHEKRILEVGSGTGLVGLALTACFAPKEVVLTDLSSHLNVLQTNVGGNVAVLPKSSQIKVAELEWGKTSMDVKGIFDVIVGTDVAYAEELYAPLIATLKTHADEHTIILLGLNRNDTNLNFFAQLEKAGFNYYKCYHDTMDPEMEGKDCAIFEVRLVNGRTT